MIPKPLRTQSSYEDQQPSYHENTQETQTTQIGHSKIEIKNNINDKITDQRYLFLVET